MAVQCRAHQNRQRTNRPKWVVPPSLDSLYWGASLQKSLYIVACPTLRRSSPSSRVKSGELDLSAKIPPLGESSYPLQKSRGSQPAHVGKLSNRGMFSRHSSHLSPLTSHFSLL